MLEKRGGARGVSRDSASILIVDDDPDVRRMFEVLLRTGGHSVETAQGGREAISRIRERQFDIILVDLVMPEVNGLEVLVAVQKTSPETVTIVLTGVPSLENAIESLRRGAFDYIHKGAEDDVILARVERGLERRRLSTALAARMREVEAWNRLAHVMVGSILASASDLGRALGEVLSVVLEVFAPRGAALLAGGEFPAGWPELLAGSEAAMELARSEAATSLVGVVRDSGRLVAEEPGFPTILAVPLETRAGRLGALAIVDLEPRTWSEEWIDIARAVADRIAVAIENARLVREIDEDRQRLRRILDTAGDGIVGLDSNRRILFFSRAAADLTGWTEEEVKGREFAGLVAPSARESFARLLSRADESHGRAQLGEVTLADRRGSFDLPCDVRCSSCEGSPADPSRWILSLRDARERRRAEAERFQLYGQLAHALQTPLASMLAHAELLEQGVYGSLELRPREMVGALRRNGRQLECQIQNMLGVEKRAGGAEECALAPMPLAPLLQETRALFAPIAAKRSIEFELESPGDLTIRGDRRLLALALDNLLFNAFKFTQPGGRVALAIRPEDDEVVFEVADTGIGIPPECQDRLFEPHFQVDPAGRGAGLGLSIVRRVAEAHGGKAEFESSPEKGTSFRIRLPLPAAVPLGAERA